MAANNHMEVYSNQYKSSFKNDIPDSNPNILQVQHRSSEYVLNKLEELLVPTMKLVEDDQPFSFSIPSRAKKHQMYDSNLNRYLLKKNLATRLSSDANSRRATNTLYVMLTIHQLLQSGVRSTLRAVYYKAAPLFRTQRECDSIVDDIACFLSCHRENLNIVGADKGEVIGNLSYTMEGDRIECFNRSQVIPHLKGLGGFHSEAKFILVIEKQATFFQLCEYHFFDRIPCILVTAKGYPDVSTRRFLNILNVELKIPVLGLFDLDPFGFHIFSVYKCGSQNMSYDSATLTTPDMRWLGILPSDVNEYKIPAVCGIDMTNDDISACDRMLREKNIVTNHNRLKEQLRLMISSKKKFEIQSLNCIAFDYLSNTYLPKKLMKYDWL